MRRQPIQGDPWGGVALCDGEFELYSKGKITVLHRALPEPTFDGDELYRVKIKVGTKVLFNGFVWDWKFDEKGRLHVFLDRTTHLIIF